MDSSSSSLGVSHAQHSKTWKGIERLPSFIRGKQETAILLDDFENEQELYLENT